jgi:hypothetical protein
MCAALCLELLESGVEALMPPYDLPPAVSELATTLARREDAE